MGAPFFNFMPLSAAICTGKGISESEVEAIWHLENLTHAPALYRWGEPPYLAYTRLSICLGKSGPYAGGTDRR